jgi:uncharacterized pyridoxal phosphate-containing UPF0001 family protein
LQIHIAKEESKFGFDRDELQAMISDEAFLNMRNVSIKGLMGMATFTDNKQQVREEFRYLNSIYEQCRHQLPDMHELSMGMSGDYSIAIEEGSTMVRIGSSIFGPRNYT